MDEPSRTSLPWLRLLAYLLVLGVCGAVAGYEFYYLLLGVRTTGVVTAVGRTGRTRTATFWAQYEYVDLHGERRAGKVNSVPPPTEPGDTLDVTFLPHAPEVSRVGVSVVKMLCFGGVAGLALVVFTAELVVRQVRGRKRRRRGHFYLKE